MSGLFPVYSAREISDARALSRLSKAYQTTKANFIPILTFAINRHSVSTSVLSGSLLAFVCANTFMPYSPPQVLGIKSAAVY